MIEGSISPKNTPQFKRQIIANCPATATKVRSSRQKQFPIPGGQVIWWNCPACHGWHALVSETEDETSLG